MEEMLKRLQEKLSAATERRNAALAARKAVIDKVEAENRADLSEDEVTEFRAKTSEIKSADEEIRATSERIDQLEAEKANEAAAQRAAARVKAFQEGESRSGGAQVTREELTYRKGSGSSYIADLTKGLIMHDGDALQRLQRHSNEVRSAPEFQEFRVGNMSSLNRVDGTGGFFVPPAWLMGQWIELARPGRPTANLVRSEALPPGTDSINIPKINSGTATAIQAADGNAVQNTALTDTSISIPVRTIAGQQDIALQLLDQSPLNFDEVVFRDLLADYAVKTDLQVINGSGTSGTVLGLLNQPSINTVAAAAVTGIGVYSAIANAVQTVHTTRFMSPSVVVMHPRRWAWLQVQVDSNGRPLVTPRAHANVSQNSLGGFESLSPEGPVGDIMGLPVITDPSLPTNLGAGTNEDWVLVLRPEDLLLYESSIRSRVLPEVNAQNLVVSVQVYGYLAFSAARYPVSTCTVTGLTTPAF